MAAPIWPISFTGARRSSRAIKEFLQGRWNGERRQGAIETIAVGIFYQNVSFQHCLCELLDEQRIAIRLGDNLVHHLSREGAAPGHLRDDGFNIVAVQAAKLQCADIGETNPGRLEVRSHGEYGKNR